MGKYNRMPQKKILDNTTSRNQDPSKGDVKLFPPSSREQRKKAVDFVVPPSSYSGVKELAQETDPGAIPINKEPGILKKYQKPLL